VCGEVVWDMQGAASGSERQGQALEQATKATPRIAPLFFEFDARRRLGWMVECWWMYL